MAETETRPRRDVGTSRDRPSRDRDVETETTTLLIGVMYNLDIKYIEKKCIKRLNLMRRRCSVTGNSWGANKKSFLNNIYKLNSLSNRLWFSSI